MKTYTEKELIRAYKQGVKDYCRSPKTLQAFLKEDIKIFTNSLTPKSITTLEIKEENQSKIY